MSAFTDRVAAGVCAGAANCSNPLVPGKKMCVKHLKIFAERAAAQRDKKKASGKCRAGGCEETKDLSKGGLCPMHLAAAAASAKRAAQRKKDAGLCVQCPVSDPTPVKPGCVLCQKHIDQLSATSSEHYRRRKDSGLCRFGNHPPLPGESLCQYHKDKAADYRLKLKLEVMEVYGGAKCSYEGCDCEDLDALDLHHVEGGGCAHRREIGKEGGGYNFYLWIRNEGYPAGYAVLCATHHRLLDAKLRKEKKDACE